MQILIGLVPVIAVIALLIAALLQTNKRVRRVEARLEELRAHFGVELTGKPLPLSEQVKALARAPQGKIAAIKLYMEQTGAGLKDAKDEVERFMTSETGH
jgi:ribosomal protein L7/L12